MELKLTVVNVNYGSGEPALSRSPTLNGYSFLVAEIRKNLRAGMDRDKAIVEALKTCVKHGILSDFINNNCRRVIKMLNFEYDAEV